jgi:hypothetical protein
MYFNYCNTVCIQTKDKSHVRWVIWYLLNLWFLSELWPGSALLRYTLINNRTFYSKKPPISISHSVNHSCNTVCKDKKSLRNEDLLLTETPVSLRTLYFYTFQSKIAFTLQPQRSLLANPGGGHLRFGDNIKYHPLHTQNRPSVTKKIMKSKMPLIPLLNEGNFIN